MSRHSDSTAWKSPDAPLVRLGNPSTGEGGVSGLLPRIPGMELHAAVSIENGHPCRFCTQPIDPGTGVLASTRITPRTLGDEPPLAVFGPTDRFHSLCVPSNYRIVEHF